MVRGVKCWCSGLCVCYVCALGGCADWLSVGPKAPTPVSSWVQPPAQLNARERQPMLSQTSPSSPHHCGEMMGRLLQECAAPSPFGAAACVAWPVSSPGLSQLPQGASALSRVILVMGFTITSDHKICPSLQ